MAELKANTITSQLYEVISTIAKDIVNNTNYTHTEVGRITRVYDSNGVNQYNVDLNSGNSVTAKVSNQDMTFPVDTKVYVLLDSNESVNLILGSVENLGGGAAAGGSIAADTLYDIIGEDCFQDTNPYSIDGLKDNEIILYRKEEINNDLLDFEQLRRNLLDVDANGLVIKAEFKTSVPVELRATNGNFGIKIKTHFLDGGYNLVEKVFILDLNDFNGNPYSLVQRTLQKKFFEISGSYIVSIDEISIFINGFNDVNNIGNIEVNDFAIFAAKSLSEEDRQENVLTISTPVGCGFPKGCDSDSKLTLDPIVRYYGVPLDYTEQNIDFYWFRQDAGVTAADLDKFCEYGGNGWRCLNEYVYNRYPNGSVVTV